MVSLRDLAAIRLFDPKVQLYDDDSADDWDFELVTQTSSRLNRFIRKCGQQKIGSRVLLLGATALLHAGKADYFR